MWIAHGLARTSVLRGRLRLAVLTLCLPIAVALDCWAGDFTAATCCDPPPNGNPTCWDGAYNYETCCKGRHSSGAKGGAGGSSGGGQGKAKKNAKAIEGPGSQSLARQRAVIDGVVVGIDLGTTYSAVAVFRGGRAEVIPNDQGNRITPSVAAFLETGERLVGEGAKNLLSTLPKQVIYDAKRLIGRGFQDRSVQMDRKTFPFRVVDRGGRPHVEVERGRSKSLVLAPEEVSALVLAKMKSIAEAYLGQEVRHAVVTVPAYFDDNQRSATMVAGEIAGLNVVRVISEPTAAAIAYGLERRNNGSKAKAGRSEVRALVYDLGGGTFDASLLSIDGGVFETLATCGNTHLGGEDFDRRVVQYLVEQFQRSTGKDPSGDRRAMQRLRVAVEGAKRALSTEVKTTVEVEAFFKGHDLRETLTRSKFEHLNAELFTKTLEPVKQVLKDAGLAKTDIDEIVMVGGSTRIPKIQQLIKDFFGLSQLPQHKVNPDEAVAIGAAIQGELLWRGSAEGQALTVGRPPSWDIVLVDVTPLSLGIEIEGGAMIVITPRNTVLPSVKTQTFTTVHDHQSHVYIPIYQGERPIAKKNRKLGQMILSGIPPAPVGVPQVDVTFRIDANGILHVTAKDKGTKQAASVSISAEKGRLSDEEVERMVQKAQRHAEQDREKLSRHDARAAFEGYLASLRSSVLDDDKARSKLSEEDLASLEEAVAEAAAWLAGEGGASVEDLQERRLRVEEVANPIVSRMYGRPSPAPASRSDDDDDDESEGYYPHGSDDHVVEDDGYEDQEL